MACSGLGWGRPRRTPPWMAVRAGNTCRFYEGIFLEKVSGIVESWCVDEQLCTELSWFKADIFWYSGVAGSFE